MERLRHFLSGFDLRATGKWFVLSSLIGIVAGVGAIVLQFLIGASSHVFLGSLAGYYPEEAAAEPAFFAVAEGVPSV